VPPRPGETVYVTVDKREQRDVILHVHNERRSGKEDDFVVAFARTFPEFKHTALCVNDPEGDDDWIKTVSSSMRTLYAPRLTPELMDGINPKIVCLHNTATASLGTGDSASDWPYGWIRDHGGRYVIAFHYAPAFPPIPADLDVFMSEEIKEMCGSLTPHMKQTAVLSPLAGLEELAQAFYPALMQGVLGVPS